MLRQQNFLCLSIQSNLKWNRHITELNSKLGSLCYAFRILSNSVSLHAACCVYFVNVHSRLRYGIIFWGSSSCSIQTFRLQKKIIRIMKKCLPRDSCKPLFIELGILPLPCLLIYEYVVFVKNDLLNGGNIFSCNIDIYNYNIRRRNHVHQVSVSTAQYKKSTYNTCTLLYNALPDDIKQLKSVHKFKFKVKSFLLQTVSIQLETILIVKKKNNVYFNKTKIYNELVYVCIVYIKKNLICL